MGKGICRLCLKTCNNSQSIGANTRNILDILQLKINLAVSREPVICTSCAIMLFNSLDLKSICVYTHQYIVSLSDYTENAKLDLSEVCQSKEENVLGIKIPENHNICGFCMGLAKSCSATFLDYQNVMLERCLPGLDLSIISPLIICRHCKESLESSFRFMEECLIVEEKIQKYCEAEGVNSEGIIELIDVQHYTSTNTFSSKEGSSTLDIIKKETFCEEGQYVDKEVGRNDESLMVVEGKKLDSIQQFMSNITSISEQRSTKGIVYVKRDNKIVHKSKNVAKRKEQKLQNQNLNSIQQFPTEVEDTFLKTEFIDIKTDQDHFDSFHNEDASPPPNANVELNTCSGSLPKQCDKLDSSIYQCDSCQYQTSHKQDLIMHTIMHKSPSESTVCQCDSCSSKTNHRYRCANCPFQTKCVRKYEIHMLIHKSLLELAMFRCDSCPFRTKYKRDMQEHKETHKQPSDITV